MYRNPLTYRALWHTDQHNSAVVDGDLELLTEHITIESKYSLISIGTELTVARGMVPESSFMHMGVPYMEGSFDLPIKYGYSLIGQIEDGQYVHCMHPHQSQCAVSPDDFAPIPIVLPPKRATLISNMETALTAIWDARFKQGDSVLIVGFGLVGSLIARHIRNISTSEVAICDLNRDRLDFAERMGFRALFPTDVPPNTFDIAFHTSTSSQGLQTSINSVAREGRVVELSWYGSRNVEVNLGGDFHYYRKQIISSQVGSIPPHCSEWSFASRKREVMHILENDNFDQHITDVISLEDSAKLFNEWRSEPPQGLGYCIEY